MAIIDDVMNDLQNLRIQKEKEQKENEHKAVMEEIKSLSNQYISALELCLDDETQIDSAVIIKEQIQSKIEELSALNEVLNV